MPFKLIFQDPGLLRREVFADTWDDVETALFDNQGYTLVTVSQGNLLCMDLWRPLTYKHWLPLSTKVWFAKQFPDAV
jgi:hypothetical protein